MTDAPKISINQKVVVWRGVSVQLLQNHSPASTTLETWDLIMRSLSHSCSSMASSPVSVRYTFTCPCSGHQAFKRAVYRPVSPVTTKFQADSFSPYVCLKSIFIMKLHMPISEYCAGLTIHQIFCSRVIGLNLSRD